MIYLSVLCIVLLAYIAYLHYAWSKTRRSLKAVSYTHLTLPTTSEV